MERPSFLLMIFFRPTESAWTGRAVRAPSPARELVRKGHGGHGEPQPGRLFDLLRQTEGAADIERDVAGPLNRPFPYGLRQLFG